MGLPEAVRVKLSSEAAEAIALTPVVVQEMAARELIGHILRVTGKDEARIREILRRGTLVSGGSRFRWTGWEADVEGLRAVLAAFPESEPGRPFSAERCVRVVLRGARGTMEIPREAARHTGLLRRSSYWDALLEVAAAAGLDYRGYSFRDSADRYGRELSAEESALLHALADRLSYPALRDRLRSAAWGAIEFYVER